MNSQNNVGIWISNPNDVSKIPSVLSALEKIDDIFLISDNDISCTDYTIVLPFHVTFMDITMVFLCVSDLLSNKDNVRSKNIVLCTNLQDIMNHGLNKNAMSGIRIIEI